MNISFFILAVLMSSVIGNEAIWSSEGYTFSKTSAIIIQDDVAAGIYDQKSAPQSAELMNSKGFITIWIEYKPKSAHNQLVGQFHYQNSTKKGSNFNILDVIDSTFEPTVAGLYQDDKYAVGYVVRENNNDVFYVEVFYNEQSLNKWKVVSVNFETATTIDVLGFNDSIVVSWKHDENLYFQEYSLDGKPIGNQIFFGSMIFEYTIIKNGNYFTIVWEVKAGVYFQTYNGDKSISKKTRVTDFDVDATSIQAVALLNGNLVIVRENLEYNIFIYKQTELLYSQNIPVQNVGEAFYFTPFAVNDGFFMFYAERANKNNYVMSRYFDGTGKPVHDSTPLASVKEIEHGANTPTLFGNTNSGNFSLAWKNSTANGAVHVYSSTFNLIKSNTKNIIFPKNEILDININLLF